ncbi:MAG: hypothetical protein H7A40_00305 [Chlamydiales bacterium]|nr:hypothetical protein [Chlamydiales bacterium]
MKILDFLFPPRCCNCQTLLKRHYPLCKECQSHIELASIEVQSCSYRAIHCFDHLSPIKSLHSKACHPSVAKLMAAFLIVQLNHLSHEPIDSVYILNSRSKPLATYCARFLKLPLNRKAYERCILVPSIHPMTPKEKRRLAAKYPRALIHISLFA